MLPGLERRHGGIAVELGWQADVDHVEARVGQHGVEFIERFYARQIDFRPRRPEVSLDAAPIAGQFFPITRANGRHATPRTCW